MAHVFRARFAGLALASLLLVVGCGAAPQEQNQPDASAPHADAGPPPVDNRCPTPANPALASPATIADAVALTNALLSQRAPVSLECFLLALKRPLSVLGVVSTFSLQASVGGALNPRVFVFSGSLIMSVVPAGDGSPFVELAEYTTPVRSIKGQLAFPVTAPVALADAYESVRTGGGTLCGGCHRNEQPAPQVTDAQAFESSVLAPSPSDVVPVDRMQDDQTTCDPQIEPDRCAILNALFGRGPVVTGAFSPDATTIFD